MPARSSLLEQSRFLVFEVGRLLGQSAGLQFGFDVFGRFLLGLRFFVFDFGFGLLFDFEAADVRLDTGGERVADTVDFGEVDLARRL